MRSEQRFQSPSMSRFAAAMTWSRMFSGGPVNTFRVGPDVTQYAGSVSSHGNPTGLKNAYKLTYRHKNKQLAVNLDTIERQPPRGIERARFNPLEFSRCEVFWGSLFSQPPSHVRPFIVWHTSWGAWTKIITRTVKNH